MKIVFICGSLEKGRDGVGDYTRQLASEIIRMGHECHAIAINDMNCDELMLTSSQLVRDVSVPVTRLSRNVAWSKRIRASKKIISSLKPEWLSLQFVPYSYNSKGIPILLPYKMKKFGSTYHWHIMFHELSLDFGLPLPLKEQTITLFQKFIIRNTIRQLQPKLISTQTTDYVQKLEHLSGEPILKLPLFSNIVKAPPNATLACRLMNIPQNTRDDFLIGLAFGNLHGGTLTNSLIMPFIAAAKVRNKTPFFVHVGNLTTTAMDQWESFNRNRPSGLKTLKLGFLPDPDLSQVIQECDFGISTTPWSLAEKSGTVATLLELRKSVWFLSNPFPGPNPELEGVSLNLNECLLHTHKCNSGLTKVAEGFLENLNGTLTKEHD
ncbi:MAG: hypothetical protein AB3N63_13010 [Puniceicoccaceae bacterium]